MDLDILLFMDIKVVFDGFNLSGILFSPNYGAFKLKGYIMRCPTAFGLLYLTRIGSAFTFLDTSIVFHRRYDK